MKPRLDPKTRYHGFVPELIFQARAVGCKKMIVVINRMDRIAEDQQATTFARIKKEISTVAKKYNIRILAIPTSTTENNCFLGVPHGWAEWYRGYSFLQVLRLCAMGISKIAHRREKQFLPAEKMRFVIDKVLRVRGIGTVAVGKVMAGRLKRGMNLVELPSGKKTIAKSIAAYQGLLEYESVGKGAVVGVNLSGISTNDLKRGGVLVDQSAFSGDFKDKSCVSTFSATLVIRNPYPNWKLDYRPLMHLGLFSARVQIHSFRITKKSVAEKSALLEKMYPSTDHHFAQKRKDAMGSLAIHGEQVTAVLQMFEKPFYFSSYTALPSLGRFIIRDNNETVAVGTVKDVTRTSLSEWNRCSKYQRRRR
eukprot:TRINITY_DN21671_c0_g1_i1.p1 TRINITY_DN21671_c0_g1~~TRINITY_DN21671_c0_g1_i1.p1  ORF type:complete len:365 (+),score=42.43 TRINITY_DN21671_c0_g1_i1:3-1097(+)